MYSDISEQIDAIAEQVRKLGHFPAGTLQGYVQVSLIKEEESTHPEELIAIILRSAQRLCSNLDKAIRGTNEDLVTQNLFIENKALIDKNIWFLNSLCPCQKTIDLQINSVE